MKLNDKEEALLDGLYGAIQSAHTYSEVLAARLHNRMEAGEDGPDIEDAASTIEDITATLGRLHEELEGWEP